MIRQNPAGCFTGINSTTNRVCSDSVFTTASFADVFQITLSAVSLAALRMDQIAFGLRSTTAPLCTGAIIFFDLQCHISRDPVLLTTSLVGCGTAAMTSRLFGGSGSGKNIY